MKNLDTLSKRILSVGLAISAIILSATLFIKLTAPANASTNDPFSEIKMNAPASPGAIMMDYSAVHVPSEDKTYYEVLVWDSQSGKSRLYYYSYSDKMFKAYEENVQLPTNPL